MATVSPIMCVLAKAIKHKYSSQQTTVKYDTQWSTLFTYVESIIILGFFCPLIIPLSFLAIFYHRELLKYFDRLYIPIPTDFHSSSYFLYISLLQMHILFIIFWWTTGNVILSNRDQLFFH